MEPQIIDAGQVRLVGMRIKTCLAENKTRELWQRFRPAIKGLGGEPRTRFFSVQCFDDGLTFETMSPQTIFEKWAAVEAADLESVPDALETLVLDGGLYAVFVHRGTPQMFHETANFIFRTWMPASGYEVDDRPHFEIMTEQYRPDDPNAEEEVWVPVRKAHES